MKNLFRLAYLFTLLSFVSGIANASLAINTVTLTITGGSESNTIAGATPTATAVKTSAGVLAAVYCFNPNSTAVFPHFYNLGTGSITPGTTSAPVVYGCPPNSGGFVFPLGLIGVAYSTAISFYVSGASSRTDNTSVGAGVIVDVVYQ